MFGRKKKDKDLEKLEADIQRIHDSYTEIDKEFENLKLKEPEKEKTEEVVDSDGHAEPGIDADLISYHWLCDGKCVWSTKDESDSDGSLKPVD